MSDKPTEGDVRHRVEYDGGRDYTVVREVLTWRHAGRHATYYAKDAKELAEAEASRLNEGEKWLT